MKQPTTYSVTIEQQDTDLTYRASITTMVGKVLNVAGVDADSKGFGIEALNENSYSWVLSRFAMELDYLPKAFDKIAIKTWINNWNRIVSTRNFIIYDSEGIKIGEVISQWCMIDVKSRSAVDLSMLPETCREYILGTLDATIERPCKVPSVHPHTTSTHRAVYSDIDFNNHVNALRYIDLMLDMAPIDTLRTANALRVDLQYQHESYYGDLLSINYEPTDSASLFEILRGDGVSAVKCKIEWR